jgi:geranylgeranyl diphosphate synthase, type I
MDAGEYIDSKQKSIERSLSASIPGSPPHVYGMLREFIFRGGKRIRPMISIACAEACGAKESDAIDYAVAIELFHNFTLIHDDVEDNSSLRRGKPTLNAEYGVPTAVNAGDALYRVMWSLVLSSNEPPEKKLRALSIMMDGFSSVVEGQGTELYWQRTGKFDISEKEYLEMASGKTGALIGLACRMGAFSADAPEDLQLSLQQFGNRMGLAFQIKDDILNLTSNPSEYKKELGEDVKESKRTLIIIKLLSTLPEKEKGELLSILRKPEKSREDVSRAVFLAKEHGAIDYANSVCERLLLEAKSCLSVLPGDKRRLFSDISDYIIRREK